MSYFKKIYIADEVDGYSANVNSTGQISVSTDTLNSLIETLQELNTRLTVLAGMANSGAPALRVAPISSVSTAVTGSVTVSGSLTSAGTVSTVASLTALGAVPATVVGNSQNNVLVELSNINNAIA